MAQAAAIGYFPDERLTAIVLSNVDSAPVNTMARDDLAGMHNAEGVRKLQPRAGAKRQPWV